jgi:hypothetical protein
MSITSFPTNNGMEPGSAFTFGPSAPAPQPNQAPSTAIAAEWHAYPSASGVVTRRAAAVVGEALSFTCALPAPATWTLVRSPSKPKGWTPGEAVALLVQNRFTPRVAGLHVLELDVGGLYRKVEIVAVAPEMLPALQCSDASAARRRLRAIAADPNVSGETIIDALETHKFEGSPTFSRLVGRPAAAPFAAQQYGCG